MSDATIKAGSTVGVIIRGKDKNKGLFTTPGDDKHRFVTGP